MLSEKAFVLLFCVLVLQVKHVYGRGDIGLDPLTTEDVEIEVRDCPSDITVTMEPCERSDVIEISWSEPKATSQTSEVTLVSQTFQSGSVFHAGETETVEYIFEDEQGNRAICSFQVNVLRAPSKCFITHGPHIVTFDGFTYGFLSDCMYTIVQSCGDTDLPDFKVTGDFLAIPGEDERFTLREMRLYYQRNEFTLREGSTVYLNGVKISHPLLDYDGVSIYWNHPNNILLTDFGLSIKFDGERNAEIFLSSSQTVCGLCGTNDFKPLNDIEHLSNGNEAANITDFVDSWASVQCEASKAFTQKCEDESSEKTQAIEQCSAVYMEERGPFGDCHLHINEVPLYDSCVENVCAFPLDTSLSCDYYEHFAQICGEVDKLPLDWREGIPPDCDFECPEGMSPSTCASACPKTCAEPSGPENCDMPCIEACVCPEGTLLDKNECVQPEDCGCTLETGEYIRQLTEWTSPDCTQKCYCEGRSELQCRNYTCNENADCVIDGNGDRRCQCHEGLNGNGEICVADSGYCQVWGDPHYLTFDGKKYNFQGGCRYTLVKTCKDSDLPDFHLYGDNKRREPNSRVSYQRILFLVYNGHEYAVWRNYVGVDGVRITLPLLNHDGVTIHYDVPFTVLETDFGLRFRYSQRTEAEIYLNNEYASLVCGLCGDFDGNKKNDFRMPNGRRHGRAKVFAKSWIVDGDPECEEFGDEDHEEDEQDEEYVDDPCQFATSAQVLEAEELCSVLSPDDDRLASCHQVANSTIYFETCKYDLCATLPDETVLCDSIEEYLVACREAGGNPGDWRGEVPQCPFECPDGFVYSHCGTTCHNTCTERNRTASCIGDCQETCLCPDGKLLDGDRCVEESECGCLLQNGQYISRGETWTSQSCTELCTCEGGQLQCDYVHCDEDARCVIENNERKCVCNEGFVSHGHKCIPKTGLCVVWGRTHFSTFDGVSHDWRGNCIYSFIKTCGNLSEGLPDFHLTGDYDPLTVTKRIHGLKRVRLNYNGHEYRIEENRVLLDGLQVTLPLNHDGVHIYLRPIFTIMETDFGLRIVYNQNANFRMHLASGYGGSVCGLCGNFDGRDDNDFMLPDRTVTTDLNVFGNSWATENCSSSQEAPNPCDQDDQLHQQASSMCSALENDELSVCRDEADIESIFQACISDLCLFDLTTEQLCSSLEAYVALCKESANVPNDWRDQVAECSFNCPEGMVFTNCGTGCPATCLSPDGDPHCEDTCVETCSCPPGQVLDGDTCVITAECGCVLDSGLYLSNGQMQVSEDCSQICSCENGEVTCHDYSCHESAVCDLRQGLLGCWCLEGYTGDGKHCRPSTSVCRIWGDPHYVTFDGRKHDFQGECEYSLVETTGDLGALPEFQLYVDNIRMNPDAKGTYFRQLRLMYNGNEFILRRGGGVRLNKDKITLPLYDFDGVTIFLRFPDVILETDFGLHITYNRRAKVEVVLSAKYGGMVGGLCGDFDENKRNDLRLPDGSLTRSVNKFGNSWATDEEKCIPEDGEDPPSPCKEDPALMAEANALCSVLSVQSAVFADCRGTGMEVFFDACTYDLCATNLNTTNICDSLQEYASACRDAGGTPGDWQSILPQCVDECPTGMVQSGCGPACPETCADRSLKRNCSSDDCFDTCLCPSGQVLDGLQCVDPENCGCTLSGGLYIQNDSTYVSENCDLFCTCMEGELSCFDYSCDENANCTIEEDYRRCVCREGYIGNGETCALGPGEGKATTTPPITIINCPSDINETLPICEGGAMISWQPPTAVSNEGLDVQLVLETEQPGKVYHPGLYGGLYRFQDENMNEAECAFMISVKSGLQIPEGHCATPEGFVIQAGETYICDDCTQQCLCVKGSLVCNEVTCADFAECAIQNGKRGCYCLEGYSGDGFSCDRTDCPYSFYAYRSSCYHFLPGPRMNFEDSRTYCKGKGADLPVIQDKAENDFLGHMNGENQKAWLLAKRHEDEDYIVESTGPGFEYKFLADEIPDGYSFLEFSVKANKEAHILLTPDKNLTHGFYKIDCILTVSPAIGADDNTRTYLTKCEDCEREFNTRTDGILNPNEHRHFFISITGRTIHFGKIIDAVTQNPMKIYVDRSKDGPLDVKYIGFATAGTEGEWAFYSK
ncbi:Zonadhesin [Holothuria leucospilota]|uniref:Zonadhesin n=1 Tax=Holothuria leucospilota TaxID=206669 RepID=A0A9Q1CE43_HOLLE|nr:Zonadhesin [Holothuria leucospilota]